MTQRWAVLRKWLGVLAAASWLAMPFALAEEPPGTRVFEEAQMDNESERVLVGPSLKEGMTFVYKRTDGRVFTYKLGARIGFGNMGSVFLIEGTHPPKIIKFQSSNARAYKFMVDEVEGMDLLAEKTTLHHAAVLRESDPRLFVVKDFIRGMTLEEIFDKRHLLSYDEQIQMHRAFVEWMKAVSRSGVRVGDLHWGNIMYDLDNHRWTIVDIGVTYVTKGFEEWKNMKLNLLSLPNPHFKYLTDNVVDKDWLNVARDSLREKFGTSRTYKRRSTRWKKPPRPRSRPPRASD